MTLFNRSGGSPTRSFLRSNGGPLTPRVATPGPPQVVPDTDTFAYTSEPLGAGGWVTGISISPDGSTRLARTDTLGAWRWDTAADQWKPSITATSMPADGSARLDAGMGVQAIVAANTVAYIGYISSIYKSVDGGRNWDVSLAAGPTTAPNSGEQRWVNTRMAVDPSNQQVCLYGTIAGGLYYTLNGGTTWTQVPNATVPIGGSGWGIPCVAIDASGNWYVAPYGNGVYRSTNQGGTWTKISSDSQFVVVTGMATGPNGDLCITGHTVTNGFLDTNSVVYRYRSGVWTQFTTLGTRKWRSVAYDPLNPGTMHIQGDGGYERASTDYGTTWTTDTFHTMASPEIDVPWLAKANGESTDYFFITVGGLQFDPVVSRRLWMSQGIGVWYADMPVTPAARPTWNSQSRGIEQLVVNDVLCPPGGSPIVSSWDRAIFLPGETGAIPAVTIDPPAQTPLGTPGGLAANLVAGYPTASIVYAWSVLNKPASSTGGSFVTTNTLSTAFTPDVVGTYVLRLTASNIHGTSHTDVSLTAVASIRGLLLPGTNNNYFSTPDSDDLDLTGSLTMRAKVALSNWKPAVGQTLIGKATYPQDSYDLRIDSSGAVVVSLYAAPGDGSQGSLNVKSPIIPNFPNGSVQWVQAVFDATQQKLFFYRSPDGVTWISLGSVATGGLAGRTLFVGTASLKVGTSNGSGNNVNGTIYRAQILDGSGTLLADFNAETITRTGTRLPATFTDSAGKVWTGTGTGWDWTT